MIIKKYYLFVFFIFSVTLYAMDKEREYLVQQCDKFRQNSTTKVNKVEFLLPEKCDLSFFTKKYKSQESRMSKLEYQLDQQQEQIQELQNQNALIRFSNLFLLYQLGEQKAYLNGIEERSKAYYASQEEYIEKRYALQEKRYALQRKYIDEKYTILKEYMNGLNESWKETICEKIKHLEMTAKNSEGLANSSLLLSMDVAGKHDELGEEVKLIEKYLHDVAKSQRDLGFLGDIYQELVETVQYKELMKEKEKDSHTKEMYDKYNLNGVE